MRCNDGEDIGESWNPNGTYLFDCSNFGSSRCNRIIPATGIPYPTGNPELPADEEFTVRKKMVQKALDSLKTTIEEQTVFE